MQTANDDDFHKSAESAKPTPLEQRISLVLCGMLLAMTVLLLCMVLRLSMQLTH